MEVLDKMIEWHFRFIAVSVTDGADAAFLAFMVEEHDIGDPLFHPVLHLLVDLAVFQVDLARNTCLTQHGGHPEVIGLEIRMHLDDEHLRTRLRALLCLNQPVLLQ